ncbi:MAG: hypothetical protein ACRD0W_17375 [Acidimicrobiales bacterium]
MDVFIIDAPNQPGELATVSEVLGGKGINIETLGGLGSGDRGVLGLLSNNDAETRSALDEAGVTYRTCPCVTVNVPHRPGELAKLTRKLADAGVNLEFVAPTGLSDTATIALGVSDADAARSALRAD